MERSVRGHWREAAVQKRMKRSRCLPGDSYGPKKPCIRCGWTLVPPGDYGGTIRARVDQGTKGVYTGATRRLRSIDPFAAMMGNCAKTAEPIDDGVGWTSNAPRLHLLLSIAESLKQRFGVCPSVCVCLSRLSRHVSTYCYTTVRRTPGSLGPHESTAPTASRSVQPFLHSSPVSAAHGSIQRICQAAPMCAPPI